MARALAEVPRLDLTAELITHRFSPKSKGVLLDWYPSTKLDMDEANRVKKLTKFGAVKHVYPKPMMVEMRTEHRDSGEAIQGSGGTDADDVAPPRP